MEKQALSKAARLLLLNTSVIPTTSYVMQSTQVPLQTIKELERLHR